MKLNYTFSSKESYIDTTTGIEIFSLNNFTNNINNDINKMSGKYFAVKYGMHYGHLLMDGIGAFLYLQKQYPDLKLVFFKYNNEVNKVCDDLINFFNAEIIDINNKNYCFEQLYFFYLEDLRITGISDLTEKQKNNIFMPIIPSGIFLDQYYCVEEGSKNWILYRQEVIKSLCEQFFKYRKQNNIKHNIYITRSSDNNRKDEYSKTSWFSLIRNKDNMYNEYLDNEIKNLGYQVIDPSEFGFFEQINIFFNAKSIVSFDGTSILNSIWCENDTKITKIMVNKEYKKINYNWNAIINASGKYNIEVLDVTELPAKEGIELILKTIK